MLAATVTSYLYYKRLLSEISGILAESSYVLISSPFHLTVCVSDFFHFSSYRFQTMWTHTSSATAVWMVTTFRNIFVVSTTSFKCLKNLYETISLPEKTGMWLTVLRIMPKTKFLFIKITCWWNVYYVMYCMIASLQFYHELSWLLANHFTQGRNEELGIKYI